MESGGWEWDGTKQEMGTGSEDKFPQHFSDYAYGYPLIELGLLEPGNGSYSPNK